MSSQHELEQKIERVFRGISFVGNFTGLTLLTASGIIGFLNGFTAGTVYLALVGYFIFDVSRKSRKFHVDNKVYLVSNEDGSGAHEVEQYSPHSDRGYL